VYGFPTAIADLPALRRHLGRQSPGEPRRDTASAGTGCPHMAVRPCRPATDTASRRCQSALLARYSLEPRTACVGNAAGRDWLAALGKRGERCEPKAVEMTRRVASCHSRRVCQFDARILFDSERVRDWQCAILELASPHVILAARLARRFATRNFPCHANWHRFPRKAILSRFRAKTSSVEHRSGWKSSRYLRLPCSRLRSAGR